MEAIVRLFLTKNIFAINGNFLTKTIIYLLYEYGACKTKHTHAHIHPEQC